MTFERAEIWSWDPKCLETKNSYAGWKAIFALICSDLLAALPYIGQIFPVNIQLLQFMQHTLRSNYSITLL